MIFFGIIFCSIVSETVICSREDTNTPSSRNGKASNIILIYMVLNDCKSPLFSHSVGSVT
ncbi:hypothetical protein D3C73_1469000 [compost metagenome]